MNVEEGFDFADYSKLIGMIYDTAQNHNLWPELLAHIETYFIGLHSQRAISAELQEKQSQSLESHFTRAIKINQHISTLEARNNTFNQILNRLPIGIIIATSNAEVVASNNRAQTVLKANQCLQLKNGRVQTSSSQQTIKLQQIICDYATRSTHKKGSSLLIKNDRGEASTSIWVTTSDMQYSDENTINLAALYITSPLISPNYDVTAIQENFGLTHAEAKLVKALANGCHNMNDVAAKLGVSIHTTRTQLKVVFEKTGTNSQIELVKKVLTSPSVLFGEPQTLQKRRVHKHEHEAHSIHLHDGRYLGFVEYGNPEGEPIMYCHSLIHADQQLLHKLEIQQQINYRIIAPKRPGFFGSSPANTSYSLQNHADDITQLANHLQLKSFTVLAYSNGAPYAAALAQQHPHRVKKLILISPFVPPSMDKINLLNTLDRFMYQFGKYMPSKAIERMTYIVLKNIYEEPHAFIDKNLSYMSEDERYFAQSEPLRDYFCQWIKAAFPERVNAVSHDLFVRIRDWQFEPSDIKVPVELWHAKDDSTVPIACAKQFAASIPTCNSHWLEQGGHYIFFTKFEDILQQSLT